MCVCMCVCIYVYMCICVYVYVYMCMCICVYMYVCVCMYVSMYDEWSISDTNHRQNNGTINQETQPNFEHLNRFSELKVNDNYIVNDGEYNFYNPSKNTMGKRRWFFLQV